MTRSLLLATLLTALALPAAALEAPKDYAGKWTLSGLSEGDAVCTLALTGEEAIGGWAVDLPKDCVDKFPATGDVAAWTLVPDGAIAFIDPLRHVVLKFEPVEIGGYVAHPAKGESIALDRARVVVELTDQQRMARVWLLTGLGGDPICIVQLASAEDGTSGTIRNMSRCQAPWTGVQFGSWKRADGKLTLLDTAGRPVITLKGDPIEGFSGETAAGDFVGFTSAAFVQVDARAN